MASFSDFVLSEDRKYIFTADETPLIYKIEVKSALDNINDTEGILKGLYDE